jgi:diguanylate cyclase (GGDEF)-like protein
MIRLTKRVFSDLAIFMTGFGILIGILFPLFMLLLGVPGDIAMTPWFFLVCILAGLAVGAVNILLTKGVVGKRIGVLVERMRYISNHLSSGDHAEIIRECTPDTCYIDVDSEDVLGDSAHAFNNLVESLYDSLNSELMVRDFTALLSTRLELQELGEGVLPSLLSFVNAEAGSIVLDKDGEFIAVASRRINDIQKLLNAESVQSVTKSGQRQVLNLPTDVMIEGSLIEFKPATVWLEPLVYHEVPFGVIVLASSRSIPVEMARKLDLVKSSLAVAFRNAMTYDQLQRLAANDSLTGIFNRRFGMARLQEEYGRAIRSGAPIGVCIFDLDHFKNVNDTYGHPMGDKVLVHVTTLLKSALREGDIALRYGGEEFMAVLPGASLTDSFQIAERVRRTVEDTSFQHGSQNLRLTISGGAASWPDYDASSAEALVRKADEGLYAAKEGGRNKIVAL